VTLDEVIARVPSWHGARTVQVTPLAGGITNENHRVGVDGQAFVVRIGGRHTGLWASIGRVAEAARRLLAAYFAEGAPPDALRRLRLMRVASDLREAIWALVQVGISGLTFDFGAYAARYLARVAAGTAALAI